MIIRNNKLLAFDIRKNNSAFTIVELLVVIVVIGILAAITIVSYSGISNKAIDVSLQSDLASSKKLLALYNVDHGYFPSTLDANYCPETPDTDARYCLKPSNGNILDYTGDGQDYTLTATNTTSGKAYEVTPTSSPVAGGGGGGGGSTTNTFVRTWGGTDSDSAKSITQTSDGGFAIAGSTSSFGAGYLDAFVAKYTSDGTLSWSKTWGGGTDTDYANSITQTSDGGFAIAGYTISYGIGNSNAFIAKFTSDGTLSWSKTWGGTKYDWANSITQISDGGFVIAGYTESYGASTTNAFLAKYTSDGTLSWSKTWGGTGFESAYSITKTSDGGFAIAGNTGSYGSGGNDAFVAKYNSDGILSWSKTWGGSAYDRAYSLTQTSDGGYAVTGRTDSYGAGGNDAFITKLTADGTLSWSKTWGGTDNDYGYSLVQTSDGGYVITGETDSYGVGYVNAFIAKFTSDGALSWSKTWGGGFEIAYSIIQTSDDSFVVAGETRGYDAREPAIPDAFIAKYTSNGIINGCSSPMCQSPTATTTSPLTNFSSVSAAVASQSATVTSPSATVTTPTATVTTIVAP